MMETDENQDKASPVIERMELPLDKFVPDPTNPNEMDEKEFELLVETIKEVGFIDPVTVVPLEDGTYAIVGGEHRWKAAKVCNLETIPADVLQGEKWKDEELRQLQNARLNVIHGKLNPEKMLDLYNKMSAKYGEKAVRLLGFASDTALKKIVKNVKKELKASLPPEMAKEFEEKAKEARTVGDLEKIIQHLFQEYGDTVAHSFMVFAWGGKEHVYISATKEVHQALKKIMKKANADGLDINELLGEAIKEVADSISE